MREHVTGEGESVFRMSLFSKSVSDKGRKRTKMLPFKENEMGEAYSAHGRD
jgi:hypothetical protein